MNADEDFEADAPDADDYDADDYDADDYGASEPELQAGEAPEAPAAPDVAEPQAQQQYTARDDEQRQQQAPAPAGHPAEQVQNTWAPKIQEWTSKGLFGADLANPAAALHGFYSFIAQLEQNPHGTISQLQQAYGVQQPDQTGYQQQAAQQAATIQTMLVDFVADKPHYQEIRPQVIQEIANIRQTSPGLPPDQALKLAYYNVMDRTGFGNVLEQRRGAERRAEQQRQQAEQMRQQKARAARARKSTAVNVKSHPTSVSTPKTMEDTMLQIASKHYGR